MTASVPSATFLTLPLEVRRQILEHVIPVTRLVTQVLRDPEWPIHCPEERTIPPLLFVNKLLYEEATVIFYERAILEIAPIKPPFHLFSLLEAKGPSLDLARSLDRSFSFRGNHFRRIQTVYIYSGQTDAVSAEGYEATLGWLIRNTAVRNIWLSFRLMTRLRKSRVDLEGAFQLASVSNIWHCGRTVWIYTTHSLSKWEQMRMSQLKQALGTQSLPSIQMYLFNETGVHSPVIDPRWDAKMSDDEERRSKLDIAAQYIDQLGKDDEIRHIGRRLATHPSLSCGGYLYQTCFILRPVG